MQRKHVSEMRSIGRFRLTSGAPCDLNMCLVMPRRELSLCGHVGQQYLSPSMRSTSTMSALLFSRATIEDMR